MVLKKIHIFDLFTIKTLNKLSKKYFLQIQIFFQGINLNKSR